MKFSLTSDSWVLAICITLTRPSIRPSKATVISAEILRKSRVRSFIVSFMVDYSQVVLFAFAVQRRGVDAQCLGGLVKGVAGGQYGADMGFFQLVQAQRGADTRCAVGRLFGHAQVADLHAFLGADDAGAFDHVAQLTDIAGPTVVEQGFAGLIAEAAGRLRVFLDEAGEETIGENK